MADAGQMYFSQLHDLVKMVKLFHNHLSIQALIQFAQSRYQKNLTVFNSVGFKGFANSSEEESRTRAIRVNVCDSLTGYGGTIVDDAATVESFLQNLTILTPTTHIDILNEMIRFVNNYYEGLPQSTTEIINQLSTHDKLIHRIVDVVPKCKEFSSVTSAVEFVDLLVETNFLRRNCRNLYSLDKIQPDPYSLFIYILSKYYVDGRTGDNFSNTGTFIPAVLFRLSKTNPDLSEELFEILQRFQPTNLAMIELTRQLKV